MKAWIVVAGNTSQQEIPIRDKKGELVDDLASAVAIKFQVKEKKEESEPPLISKDLVIGIEINQPSLGYLRITLLPSDTNIRPSERYVMALQIEWSGDDEYEVKLTIGGQKTSKFVVEEGIIE